jgi:aspartokinase/homoserine dehydrogenase 1
VVINRNNESKALNSLHETFFLSDAKELHLFLVGVGLIGSTLIKQIQDQAEFLRKTRSLEIRIVGMTNTKTMYFDEAGIDLTDWKKTLKASETVADMKAFVKKMKALNLPNSIFVDNTADESIAAYYEEILDASISISTPNKIATSSAYLQYQRLKTIAQKRGVQFLYETNVGAGLPVISTLNDLIISGDQITKIEGVLSGSLSFIFNSYKAGTSFSDIVKEAQQRGYTEPDPRVDLNGLDVRRKLIILARESGYPIEAKEVKIENILPVECQEAVTVESFFAALEKADAHFEAMRQKAEAEGKVLRMIAKLDNGHASIGLEAVGSSHPFFGLSGSDNMIVFTTKRYEERPLVVRGPGAGAEVTAAGVFAEIIKIGNLLY